jgi:hypothetical protein
VRGEPWRDRFVVDVVLLLLSFTVVERKVICEIMGEVVHGGKGGGWHIEGKAGYMISI